MQICASNGPKMCESTLIREASLRFEPYHQVDELTEWPTSAHLSLAKSFGAAQFCIISQLIVMTV